MTVAQKRRRLPDGRMKAAAPFLLVALVGLACQQAPTPVARLAARPQTLTLPLSRVVPLQLDWAPLVDREVLGPRPTAFVHLVDEWGEVVRTFDHRIDLDRWTPGEIIRDEVQIYQSHLADGLEPGRYQLTAGLYELGGERYELASDHPEMEDDEFAVAALVVPDHPEFVTTLRFEGDWMPVEPGLGAQNLARRWLGRRGVLIAEPVSEPIRLTLLLTLPRNMQG